MKTKRLTVMALLTAAAMILSYVESLLPSVAVPGVKLGLANIAVIFALYRLGWREALAISAVRVFLVSMLFGSMSALLYSLSGAVLSLLLMGLLRRTDRFSAVGVSVAGGVAHNLGQVLMAMLLLGSRRLIYYYPILVLSGVAGGVVTGLTAAMLVTRIPPFEK
ncbi:MAG: Gx transporter family protein [Oscillospiraceae bacterium]|nr:Gx transporter family protein [Oscillospiraceae bacterium]